MPSDLVVVSAHGNKHIGACRNSLGDEYPVLVIDTASPDPVILDHVAGHDYGLHRMPYETYQTGAMLWAYENTDADNLLFIQDSMCALRADYLEPFKELQPERGCVAWATFTDGFPGGVQPVDEAGRCNEDFGRYWYDPASYPPFGIFGCVFYCNGTSLDELAKRHLLPPVPRTKIHEQSNERLWSWAFHEAGMEVRSVVGQWSKGPMERGEMPPFRKIWANRS